MKKTWLTILIIFGCLAMIGIIVVQIFWVRNALDVSNKGFDNAVNQALVQVVDKLEKKESTYYLSKKLNKSLDNLFSKEKEIRSNSEGSLQGRSPASPDQGMGKNGMDTALEYRIDGHLKRGDADSFSNYFKGRSYDNQMQASAPPFPSQQDSLIRQFFRQDQSLLYDLLIPGIAQPDNPVLIPDETNGAEFQNLQSDLVRLRQRMNRMNEVIRDILVEVETRDQKIENRLDTVTLRQELAKALKDKGINLSYDYAVVSGKNDSLTKIRSTFYSPDHTSSTYRVGLFPNDLISESNSLLIYFHGQKIDLLNSISWLLLASLLFTLAMLIAFLANFRAMIKQKKISEIKTDFINNMTHEFKTPISTINLAIDSINNPRVINDPERIKGLTKVIREENQRMNIHVEQVLQMALFDRREFNMNFNILDVHDLLRKSVETVYLQVEKKDGVIHMELNARDSVVSCDEVHLLNAFLNLLDNAIKYSPNRPEITVFSRNGDKQIIVGVADKGIGMSHESQKRIFEKFFRTSTGNLHNVKGFGLGLSYVKAIVESHKGKIYVWSEPGHGSRFEISLPLPKNKQVQS